VLTLILSILILQTPSTPSAAPTSPAADAARAWTGCVQAGSAPSTYRLNLDSSGPNGRERAGATAEGTQGDPFVQLVGGATTTDLTKYVGKHVRITGRQLSDTEAAQEAARHPNRQEAAETAAGTGGTPQRHDRYVRIQAIAEAPGDCR